VRAASYQVWVTGRLSDALLDAFADLEPSVVVQTVLLVPDEAALYGLLERLQRLQRLGLQVAEVRRLPTKRLPPTAGQPGPPAG
jgi:hypothetical protein